MKSIRNILLILSSVMIFSCQPVVDFTDEKYHPIKPPTLPDIPVVEIKDGLLYVNGEEFFVCGAAVNGDNKDSDRKQEFWREAKAAGANVIRMYGVNGSIRETLDEIAMNGMYVCFGINIGRQCNGFDYNDDFARRKQLSSVKSLVDEIKDHPAILMWCIGNELEGEVDILNKNVWDDVNEISEYIHKNDSRPTTVALCWPWGVLDDIKTQVPDIDFICINQYVPEIYDVHNIVKSSGYDKPYIVSEFGPMGTWNNGVPTTEWGCLIEESGSQKAAEYRKIYNECVFAHKGDGCIGSFVFLWGYQSHGDVLTWYAMFDQFMRHSLPAVDVMSELWTGVPVDNKAPVIASWKDLRINGMTADENIKLAGGDIAEATIEAIDAEGDQITYDWRVIRDERLEAGQLMQPLSGIIQGKPHETASFVAPGQGNYRLIVFARDAEHKKTDMVAIPFQVTNGDDPEPVGDLFQHDTDEIWFSPDSNSGGYFNLENAARFTYGQDFNQADMDMIVFRGTGKTALTFCAPTDVDMQKWIDNSVADWTVQNPTKFKKVMLDFDAIISSAEIEDAYETAGGEDGRCVLMMYETLVAKTADGHYALIKVTGGTKYGELWGSFKLSFKTIR